MDETGRILAVERTPLDFRGPEAFAATLAELSRAVMAAGGAEPSQVEYVGVGLPGAVSGGDVVYTTNIPMENVPLEALFRHTLDLPLLLGNDGRSRCWRNSVSKGTSCMGMLVVKRTCPPSRCV